MSAGAKPVTIRVLDNGPLLVEGPVRVQDMSGEAWPAVEGRATELCRCGGSERKPFCDGAHSRQGFSGVERAYP